MSIGPLQLQPSNHASFQSVSPVPGLIVDVLVLNAATLIEASVRSRTVERILDITQRSSRTLPHYRGPWLLVLTHTCRERQQAYELTKTLSTRCQGVRAVEEQKREFSGRAAFDLHRLHFPAVPNRERPLRILIFGSARMRALFCSD